MRAWTRIAVVSCLAACLAACGGGGSGSGDNGGGGNPPPNASITIDTTAVSATAAIGDPAPTQSFVVTAANIPADGLYIELLYTDKGISGLELEIVSDNQARVDIYFRAPDAVGTGIYADSITVRVCHEDPCTRHATGSPATVSASYKVEGSKIQPEADLPALPVQDRTALAHDVIDAEYSEALDAIVMVSSRPTNALHVLDPVSGARYEVALSKTPTAVSVSPDGLSAAVGHDALITWIDLAELVQSSATTPVHLDVSARVHDLVLDGRGFVHAFPAEDQWVSPHSIEIATNTETLGTGFTYAMTRGKLHPSGDHLYAANAGLSPDDIQKYDITSGTAHMLYDSPYHGSYAMCSNLWLKEDGQTIYTACGNTFRASEVQGQDMSYTGSVALSGGGFGYRIAHLSQSDDVKEIMLIELDWYNCGAFGEPGKCWTHLNLYESDFLNRTAQYSIPPLKIGDSEYMQRGLFAFHSADGTRRYVISFIPATPTQPHYLSVLQ
jgi:hypothetical protein